MRVASRWGCPVDAARAQERGLERNTRGRARDTGSCSPAAACANLEAWQLPSTGPEPDMPTEVATPGRLRDALTLLGWIALCQAAGVSGSLLTVPNLRPWYDGLSKPAWNPPDSVFAPVWITLFLLMAVAAWRVQRSGPWAETRPALVLFALQLGLNVGWSALFFALRSPGAALVEIALLWLAIASTAAAFWRRERWAGALMTPYLAWVSYAAALNVALWRLNG